MKLFTLLTSAAILLACGMAVPVLPAPTLTPYPASTAQPVWTPAPPLVVYEVEGVTWGAVNIRECASMSCTVLSVAQAGAVLKGACNRAGWCYDVDRRGWFWRGCLTGEPGGCR